MAIAIARSYSVPVTGDGTSVEVSIDFWEQINADTVVHSKTPIDILSVSLNEPGYSNTVTATLNGSVVTFTMANPLPSGAGDIFTLAATLSFSAP